MATAAFPQPGEAVPQLLVESPERYERQAERIRDFDPERMTVAMRLVGLEQPGPPIRVILAPEGSPEARAVRDWVAGYAVGADGPIVLFPARSPSYPDSSLEELMHHEVAHILISRAAAGRPVPRWFHEGVAMAAGSAWNLGDSSRFSLDVLRRGRTPLARVDRLFAGGGAAASRAYAVSGAFVEHLRGRHGPWVTGEILSRMGAGASFENAFQSATGDTVQEAEEVFWRRQTFWRRWVPFLTSGTALWLGITLLALLAFRRRKQRDEAMAERWEREDRWRQPDPSPRPHRTFPKPTDPDSLVN